MPDEVIAGLSDAALATVLDDYAFEGYAVIEKTKQPDGTWTVAARKNEANGAPQSADDGAAVQPVPVNPTPPAQQTPAGKFKLGPDGERLIKAFESCARSRGPGFGAYRDSIGVLTIGWGHTNHLGRQFTPDAVWTQQECDTEFSSDMRVFEGQVSRLVRVPLNQRQFDALVSFCYNCGQGNLAKSTLLKKVNQRDFGGAALEFGKWVKAGGQTLKGLVRRRKYEARLFQGMRDLTYPP